jgi:uncharacterized protein YgbK (DUF1537 family)
MPIVFALADDLTGALETGAKFAGRGVASVVTMRAEGAGDFPVVVIDTESRNLSPAEAAAAVSAAAGGGARIVFKKTDSTLRGNIAAELGALVKAYPGSPIAYIGAYPAMGRTVKDGRLLVHGVPVHETPFAVDTMNPIADSSIAHLLGRGLPCVVHDGETDADVERAVAEALADPNCRVIAGPASVAGTLAAQLELPRRPVPAWPRIARCLVVNGSRQEMSQRQIAWAEERGYASSSPSAAWRILRPGEGTGLTPLALAAETGRRVGEFLTASEVDAMMVFGGDTAYGILKALGCPPLEPMGEVVTGVPVARVAGQKLIMITKAGGFGDEGVVGQVRDILDGNRR